MSIPIALRADFDAGALRRVAKVTKDAAQGRRLLALADIYDGGTRTDAARIGGVGLQTVQDWVLAFNAEGPEGLIDGKGKPHASSFKGEDAELAEKAAGLMGMHVLRVVDDTHRELASGLPVERVFASGKAFVPVVKKLLYDPLCAMGGHPVEAARTRKATDPRSATAGDVFGGPDFHLPLHWSAIKPGSLVLATESDG